jgi:hypothetical protein
MVIAIILTSWVGFSTILCLAFAGVAARTRPLLGDNFAAEAETPSRQTLRPDFEAVCATS